MLKYESCLFVLFVISVHVKIISFSGVGDFITDRTLILLAVGEVLALEVAANIVLGPVVELVAQGTDVHQPPALPLHTADIRVQILPLSRT